MANMGQKGVFWGVNSWTMWIEWMRVWPGGDPGGQKWSKGGVKGGPFLDPLFGGGSFWGVILAPLILGYPLLRPFGIMANRGCL